MEDWCIPMIQMSLYYLKYSSTRAYKELRMKWKTDDIDINKIATNLSESICNSLISIHSFTVDNFSNI